MHARTWFLIVALVGTFALAWSAFGVGQWTPTAWKDVETLEFLTVGPEEGEHWSTVWLVVIDDQVYIRLGSTAAERIEKNTKAPTVGVKIGGHQFDSVNAVPAPDKVEPVAQA